MYKQSQIVQDRDMKAVNKSIIEIAKIKHALRFNSEQSAARFDEELKRFKINTQGFLGGEIRGQVRRGFTCPEVVAVNEIEDIKQVNVSPVPFQDVLNINLESISSFEGRLVLHDLLGGRVLSQAVQISEGEQSLEFQTGELPKGVYLLSLEVPSQQRSMFLKKVVRVD